MTLRLGMLGMWHTHADGIVRQVVANPQEFTLVGFYDPDPKVVAARQQRWQAQLPNMRVFESADALLKYLRRICVRGIAHAFNGSEQQADTFVALGFKLGFGGAMTFDGANHYVDTGEADNLSRWTIEA